MSLDAIVIRDARSAYTEGQASMAKDLDRMRLQRDAAESEARIWRRRHKNLGKALATAVTVGSIAQAISIGVILWLRSGGG